ncbi:MAG: NAD+ synthase [Candidatus Gygaella obscura]|nr:NAD+ synthase [Candidatus Gygaella obscura]
MKRRDKSIRISLAQINLIVGDLNYNINKIISYIADAKKLGSDIVVFPELAITGYPPEDLILKKHFVDDNLKYLKNILKYTKGITCVLGFINREDKNLYNSAAIINDGKIRGIYHKINLPNYSVFDEKRYFTPGEYSPVFSLAGLFFGVNICWDIWQDNNITKTLAKKGAELIINISASPFHIGKKHFRREGLVRRIDENNLAIAYCNLVGGIDELVFDGDSLIMNKDKKIIAIAGQFTEQLVTADIPLKKNLKRRYSGDIIKLKAFENKRKVLVKDNYNNLDTLSEIYNSLVLGTRDYIVKNGFKKVVIGLSGGIDSSLVAAIAVDAIGKNNCIGVFMNSRFTSSDSVKDSRELARRLKIKTFSISIEDIFKSYIDTLKKIFINKKIDTTEENIQARIRGNILMALSNKFKWLVLTTGNKSEIAVGYCTLYGDMAGGFAALKDVPKTMVYKLAEFFNKNNGNLIPVNILKKAPSAELKLNQKDQDSLPAYDVLDDILKHYVEDDLPVDKIRRKTSKGFNLIKKVVNLVDSNEYKRRQVPLGVKISKKAFGKDRRLPVTNKYKDY